MRGYKGQFLRGTRECIQSIPYIPHNNLLEEDIKSSLHMGNACYHAVQNLLSSCLIYKDIVIKTYKTLMLSVVLYGYET